MNGLDSSAGFGGGLFGSLFLGTLYCIRGYWPDLTPCGRLPVLDLQEYHSCKISPTHRCQNDDCGIIVCTSRSARFVMSLHKEAPVTACRSSGLSTPAIQLRGPMSFIAIFISLVVIIGAALVVLTAVVGYGCYSLFREFSAKPPRQLDA
jgi:hypothetical protein